MRSPSLRPPAGAPAQCPACVSDPQQRAQFLGLCRRIVMSNKMNLTHLFHEWRDSYEDFDPDHSPFAGPSTGKLGGGAPGDVFQEEDCLLSPQARVECFERFRGTLLALLSKAGFSKVSASMTAAAISRKSKNGVAVVPPPADQFHISMFYRGLYEETVVERSWWSLFRPRVHKQTYFQKLLIFFSVKDPALLRARKRGWLRRVLDPGPSIAPHQWFFRLFHDFNQDDIDMLLPGCRIKFSSWDYANVFVPVAIGIGSAAYKLATATLVFDSVTAVATSLAMIGGPLLYAVKAYFSFKDKETDYRNELNNILLLKSLGANANVLAHLLETAQEQEDLEAILAYYFLWGGNDSPEPVLKQRLDLKVETFLNLALGLPKKRINFEVGDAIRKLQRMGILTVKPSVEGDLLQVHNLDAATKLLPPWDPYAAVARQGEGGKEGLA